MEMLINHFSFANLCGTTKKLYRRENCVDAMGKSSLRAGEKKSFDEKAVVA
jgi:hypothetical protein